MKDKVSELREILNQKKTMQARQTPNQNSDDSTVTPQNPDSAKDQATILGDSNESQDNNELQAEVTRLRSQIEEFKNASEQQREMYLRQAAEFENMKKRLQKEHDDFRKYAHEKILEEFFPVMDNLEMTVSHAKDLQDPIVQGVQLTLKQFLITLEKYGVQQISGEGLPFNPNLQEAIGTQPSDSMPANHVVTVHRKGYKLHDKLIRAAMVTVSA